MGTVLIVVATYQRTKKLQRCLDSIFASSYWDYEIVVVADNQDYATQEYLAGPNLNRLYEIVVQPSQQFVIGAWNRGIKENINEVLVDYTDNKTGTFLYSLCLCDDVILEKNTIENAVNALNKQFPDGDGVVGLKQVCKGHDNYTFKWFGQVLMGRKFIERYKSVDYQICCPDYFHFVQDREMYDYANSLGKFYCCNEAVLDHDHPSFTGSVDSTHHITRERITPPIQNGPSLRRPFSLMEYDFKMEKERIRRGYLWGKNFNLVGKIL